MSNHQNPYTEALKFIRSNPGTSGAAGLAKLVLSLYNSSCSYSFAECVGSLDSDLTRLSFRMITEYVQRGESNELLAVGEELSNKLYPGLWEMGMAMDGARVELRAKWAQDRKDKEAAEIESAEMELRSGKTQRVPFETAKGMLSSSDGLLTASYFKYGEWATKNLRMDVVLNAITSTGTSLTSICPDSSRMLAVQLDDRLYYVPADYDACEEYLAAVQT